MKFQRFKFHFFPRIRRRKKHKSKLGYADYPRDISRDRGSKLYQASFPGFHDNLAAEADNSGIYRGEKEENQILTEDAPDIYYSSFNSLPFAEPKVDMAAGCSACSLQNQGTDCVHCLHPVEACKATPCGTPSTVPRTRTRIKTNPWLPSPGSSPNLSPADRPDTAADTLTEAKQVLRPNYLPLTCGTNGLAPIYSRIRTNRKSGLQELAEYSPSREISGEVNEFDCRVEPVRRRRADHKSKDKLLGAISEVQSLDDMSVVGTLNHTKNEDIYRTITEVKALKDRTSGNRLGHNKELWSPCSPTRNARVLHIADDELCSVEEIHSPLGANGGNRLYYSYDTDLSSDTSPVVEFLKHVKYEINFSYEQTADALLENSSLSRDDSFQSFLEYEKNFPESNDVVTSNRIMNIEEKTEDINNLSIKHRAEESPSTMQESTDTGYASVSNESDEMSFGSDYGENFNELFDDFCNDYRDEDDFGISGETEEATSDIENDETCLYSPAKEGIGEMNSNSDIDQSLELEWDEDPSTQTLLFKYDLFNNNINGVKFRTCGSFKQKGSSNMEQACVCRRRSRSLADIEISLDEKVTLLREEKSFVQRKIHEAICEEKIRDHQLRIFRLLSGNEKKAAILDTLYDLKSRLDDQSKRLQASYTTVLSLRDMFAKRHVS